MVTPNKSERLLLARCEIRRFSKWRDGNIEFRVVGPIKLETVIHHGGHDGLAYEVSWLGENPEGSFGRRDDVEFSPRKEDGVGRIGV